MCYLLFQTLQSIASGGSGKHSETDVFVAAYSVDPDQGPGSSKHR